MIDKNVKAEEADHFHNKKEEWLVFSPEPQYLSKLGKKQFTVGKKYEVLNRTGPHGQRLRLRDDRGAMVYVDEMFFVPAVQTLIGDFDTELKPEVVPQPDLTVLRPKAKETIETIKKSLKPGQEFYELPVEQHVGELKAKYDRYVAEGWASGKPAPEPNVKDNPLLWDTEKFMVRMGKVFPEYATVDRDEILQGLSKLFPGRAIEWKNYRLTIDGAVTKINTDDARKAFDGLKAITSVEIAQKLVCKAIASKLKKVF